jgi:hypothetical protein
MKAFLRPATAPFGVLAFWGGMALAARHYPAKYDWQYTPLSGLISPSRDPGGHLWASGGALLCGLCGFCWVAALVRKYKNQSAKERPGGTWPLRLGNFFMICSAVLPSKLLRVSKGHEILVTLAFAGLCLGMVSLTFQTVHRRLLRRTGAASGRPRFYAAVLAGGAVFPIVLAGLAQAYVYYALPQLHWVNRTWRARGVPVYLSFAFWEWVTCAVLSAYMAAIPLLAMHVGQRYGREPIQRG